MYVILLPCTLHIGTVHFHFHLKMLFNLIDMTLSRQVKPPIRDLFEQTMRIPEHQTDLLVRPYESHLTASPIIRKTYQTFIQI